MANVQAIDMRQLASLCGCTVEDLAGGVGRAALTAVGVVTAPQTEVVFPRAPAAAAGDGLDTVVMSLASRPGVLDSTQTPKALLPLAGEPVIAHVLRQLQTGGIKYVVVVIGAMGGRLKDEINRLSIAATLTINYVDVGEGYLGGFARSLSSVRTALTQLQRERFLFATADHIFDPSLIMQMRHTPVSDAIDAVALVEHAVGEIHGLPPTAVRVSLDPPAADESVAGLRTIAGIGKRLSVAAPTDGIEAGLYAWTTAALDCLDELAATRSYFTVAQAMATLAASRRLGAEFTAGKAWYAIETADQLSFAKSQVTDAAGSSVRFPWQVTIARADSFSHSLPHPTDRDDFPQRLVIALRAAKLHRADEAASAAVAPMIPLTARGELSTHAEPPPTQSFSLLASTEATALCAPPPLARPPPKQPPSSGMVALAEPLLSASPPAYAPSRAAHALSGVVQAVAVAGSLVDADGSAGGMATAAARASGSGKGLAASLEEGVLDDATMTIAVGSASAVSETAYLIAPPSLVDANATSPATARNGAPEAVLPEMLLALPQRPQQAEWLCGVPAALPSAVHSMTLEVVEAVPTTAPMPLGGADPLAAAEAAVPSTGSSSNLRLQLTVEKRVPLVGWALLATALVLSNSAGPVTDLQLQGDAHPPGPWLRAAWRGLCSLGGTLLVVCSQPNTRRSLHQLWRLAQPQRLELLGAGVAFFVNFGGFSLALLHTSVSHAALFESTASLWLVLGQLLAHSLGRAPAVPRAQALGVACGALGVLLCFFDAPAPASAAPASATTLVSAALASAAPAAQLAQPPTARGDLLALCAGLGSCVYLSFGEALRSHLEPAVFYGAVLAQYTLLAIAAACLLDDAPPSLSLDATHGLFGWLQPTPSRLFPQLWMLAGVDLMGNMGYIAVMKYVPSLIVAVALLLSPLLAALEGICLGVDSLPGVLTWVGAAVIVSSSAVIVADSQSQSNTVELKLEHVG